MDIVSKYTALLGQQELKKSGNYIPLINAMEKNR